MNQILSPRGRMVPIKPVLLPLTASFEAAPSFFFFPMAGQNQLMIVWKNGEVLKVGTNFHPFLSTQGSISIHLTIMWQDHVR